MKEKINIVKPIRKQVDYKGRCIKITQLKNGNWKAVAGGLFVVAHTELEGMFYIKSYIDAGW
jgi:hypothetical protein